MDQAILSVLAKKAHQLPLDPGVYIMKDQRKDIIYIGKAKHLKNRVSSYFRSVDRHTEKVYRMVEQVRDFDFIVTDSEFEALVLECSLIKQYTPKYNILLKDDKGYSYIRVGRGGFGRITSEKQQLDDGALYMGPYTSSFVVSQTVDEANRVFMLPTCSRKFPQDLGKGRPCLNFHIKQCMGVCRGKISQEEYEEILTQAVDFIRGGSTEAIKKLKDEMYRASEDMEFERAARLRDRIRAIERSTEQQKVIGARVADQDIVAFSQLGKQSAAGVLRFRGGKLVDKDEYVFHDAQGLQELRAEFVVSFYRDRSDLPRQIAVDDAFEGSEALEQYLSQRAGHKVTITVPKRAQGLQLVEMARKNAAEKLSLGKDRTNREVAALDELARLLGLPQTPGYIEAYDISNIGADTIVAGMVVFEDGRPRRDAYKRFQIKQQAGPDDYASMREVISRRIARYQEQKQTGEGFGRLPDLILLDGGQGHVGVVRPLFEQAGLAVPVFGMVKDNHHKTRAIAADGAEIAISSNRSAFTLVSKIQEEVHRFAITYSRARHTKNALASTLMQAPGIGPKRARELYRQFRSMAAIRAATVGQLAEVPGMTQQAAQSLHDLLQQQ